MAENWKGVFSHILAGMLILVGGICSIVMSFEHSQPVLPTVIVMVYVPCNADAGMDTDIWGEYMVAVTEVPSIVTVLAGME